MDMWSGGSAKENWDYIYIEAPEDEAKTIFENRFGHSPDDVCCACCGPNYSYYSTDTLEEITAFERGCHWDGKLHRWDLGTARTSLDEYLDYVWVLCINATELDKEGER